MHPFQNISVKVYLFLSFEVHYRNTINILIVWSYSFIFLYKGKDKLRSLHLYY